jgi:hypothetical protein
MKNEKCESKVSNLLAGLDSLDDEDVKGKIRLLVEAIEILDKCLSALHLADEDLSWVLYLRELYRDAWRPKK